MEVRKPATSRGPAAAAYRPRIDRPWDHGWRIGPMCFELGPLDDVWYPAAGRAPRSDVWRPQRVVKALAVTPSPHRRLRRRIPRAARQGRQAHDLKSCQDSRRISLRHSGQGPVRGVWSRRKICLVLVVPPWSRRGIWAEGRDHQVNCNGDGYAGQRPGTPRLGHCTRCRSGHSQRRKGECCEQCPKHCCDAMMSTQEPNEDSVVVALLDEIVVAGFDIGVGIAVHVVLSWSSGDRWFSEATVVQCVGLREFHRSSMRGVKLPMRCRCCRGLIRLVPPRGNGHPSLISRQITSGGGRLPSPNSVLSMCRHRWWRTRASPGMPLGSKGSDAS